MPRRPRVLLRYHTCTVWYHTDCQGIVFAINHCTRSHDVECQNFLSSLFDTTTYLNVSNRFETLSYLSESNRPIPDGNIATLPHKKRFFSLIVQQSKEAKSKTKKAVLNHELRILIMSIKNKSIESGKSDIVLRYESWLTPDIKN